MLTLYTHGFCGIKLLISQHHDAEWLMQAAKFLGYDAIRGSSGRRGAISALREMMRESKETSVALTPDGPRGPRRTLAQGAVFLASKTQLPIVCIGAGFDRPWRIKRAWDKFAIPRPYSRARTVVCDKIHIPKKLGRAGLDRYSEHVRDTLQTATLAAEQWAESGRAMEGGAVVHRHPRPKAVLEQPNVAGQFPRPRRHAA